MIDPVQIPTKRTITAPRHLWEEAVDEVLAWIEEMVEEIPEALLFRGHSPFAADLSEAQKLEYYRDVMSTPEGRDALMERAGIEGYVNVVAALAESSPQSLPAAPSEPERRNREAPGYA